MPKNSENVLVAGVVGLLALILIVAVVFGDPGSGSDEVLRSAGNDAAAGAEGEGEGEGAAGPGLDEMLRGPVGETTTASSGGEDTGGAGSEAVGGPGADGDGETDDASALLALDDSDDPSVTGPAVTALGNYRVDQGYRVVTVQPGDTFSALVLNWMGSLDRLDEVEKVNEGIDFERLAPGIDLYFPWVPNSELYLAREERRAGSVGGDLAYGGGRGVRPALSTSRDVSSASPSPRGAAATRRSSSPDTGRRSKVPYDNPVFLRRGARSDSTPPRSVPTRTERPVAASPGRTTHTVRKNESLWKIAADRVGAGRASEYVKQIVAANPAIQRAEYVREGQKIVLP